MSGKKRRYDEIEELWKASLPLPALEAHEATLAVKKLLRSEGIASTDYDWKVTSGRNYT